MIETLIQDHRILIVGGSGGVGKTSVSAALGLASAQAGYRTLVLTIDPARRLAAALGLDGIDIEATDVTPRLSGQNLAAGGELHAMMLDVKNTLDQAVERYAPDPKRRREILDNRLYQNISTRLSGSQEFAAMQRLQEIAAAGEYERIILDTPPTTQALDFLTAPERLQAFFDSSLMRVFMQFGGTAGRGFFRVSDVFFKTLERLTGAGVIRDIGDFFRVAESILEPFSQQARKAQALLREAQTAFAVVTGPYPHQLEAADRFRVKLGEMNIQVGALIVNRWLQPQLPTPPAAQAATHADPLGRRMAYWGMELERLAHEQTRAIEALSQVCPHAIIRLAEMDHAGDSLASLAEMADRMLDQEWIEETA
ncbi:MAG: ArsA family ATPase [Wenzhouxiangella sp.]